MKLAVGSWTRLGCQNLLWSFFFKWSKLNCQVRQGVSIDVSLWEAGVKGSTDLKTSWLAWAMQSDSLLKKCNRGSLLCMIEMWYWNVLDGMTVLGGIRCSADMDHYPLETSPSGLPELWWLGKVWVETGMARPLPLLVSIVETLYSMFTPASISCSSR